MPDTASAASVASAVSGYGRVRGAGCRDWIQDLWFGGSKKAGRTLCRTACFFLLKIPLFPLSVVFRLAVALRRHLYRNGYLASYRLPVPTIVVGNITVGGSGKTPLLIALAEVLKARGFHPGIISRGYGADKDTNDDASRAEKPRPVMADAMAAQTGDEPLLIARRTGCPVWVGRDRFAVGQALLVAHPECDVILSDDGLQHYRLARDMEIVVFDDRGIGNGHLLPLGPLREPLARLAGADAVVWNGEPPVSLVVEVVQRLNVEAFHMQLISQSFVALGDPARFCNAADLSGKKLYALAGIGNPERFFTGLAALGLSFESRAFPDHHAFTAADIAFARDGALLMTEKDAVKCAALATGVDQEIWVLPVSAQVSDDLVERILEKINGCKAARHSGMPDLQGQPRI